ncbi:MAG: glycosyltransferase family A protein [Devosia sp.]
MKRPVTRTILVTPAGRRAYLDLLAHYVAADPTISEWHLWDNCRSGDDRAHLAVLAARDARITIVPGEKAPGKADAINRFYARCTDDDTFYIKLDDDIVWLPPRFGALFTARALADRGRYAWWSPVVVNNAICTWAMQHLGRLETPLQLSALADDRFAWRSAEFAASLHESFIDATRTDRLERFAIPDLDVTLRFSINCIGFFGDDVAALGERFCPPGADDEDWISAVLPAITQKPGRIVGDLLVSHFAFFPQENRLLHLGQLDGYYGLAGLTRNAALPFRTVPWARYLGQRFRPRRLVPIDWRAAPPLHLPKSGAI